MLTARRCYYLVQLLAKGIMIMKRVYDFLKAAEVYYLAAVEF